VVVHDLRLRGMVRVPDAPDLLVVIDELTSAEIVHTRGKFMALTEQGRVLHAEWALAQPGTDARSAAERLYDEFHAFNTELLSVCTAWQVRPGGAANDHRDANYDWQVIARLERLHERAATRIRRVGRALPRFSDHDRRLRSALRKVVDDNDVEWFTSPRIDSYHTVWNQLHEDLLITLGRSRDAEPLPGS
jgi:hypothetical protein